MKSQLVSFIAVVVDDEEVVTDEDEDAPLAGEANNLKSQSQQEGMWLEAQVNLYNMWTPIGKSDVNFFFN